MLTITGFSKMYAGAKVYSAKDISFHVDDGQVLGLVGSNGAGKSTTIKCLTGILPYTEGTINVNGFDVNAQPIQAKQSIGYVPDDHSVYEKLTGREYVNYMGSLYGVKKEDKQKRLDFYAERLSITHALDNQIGSYSHGMKQKICIIGSIIHNPKLWVLDEPMMGLDPQTMAEVRKCIRSYADLGNTVVFSSHNLDVVQKVCDLVGIIRKGELVAFFSLEDAEKVHGFDLERYFMRLNMEE